MKPLSSTAQVRLTNLNWVNRRYSGLTQDPRVLGVAKRFLRLLGFFSSIFFSTHNSTQASKRLLL